METDSFQIILDTYRDQQTGFVFGTNPVGIEYDGQVTREGEGGAFSAGGFNKNWDGVWEVTATIGDFGWSAEFAIPFTTLRYPRGEEQSWSLNMQRNIRHRNERVHLVDEFHQPADRRLFVQTKGLVDSKDLPKSTRFIVRDFRQTWVVEQCLHLEEKRRHLATDVRGVPPVNHLAQ